MQTDFDKELAAFFTDVEHLRDAFKNSVAAPTLTKRLFIIHGVGGVGKSSLLRMFRLHCKGVHVPVALASGDDSKSALDVLYLQSPSGEERGWVSDLKADGVCFPKFDATFEHYRKIQAKLNTQVKKAGGRAADIAGKAASKTAEAAGGALAGAVIGSVIPGIGTAIGSVLGGVLGGISAEALIDWLRGFLSKPDIDLLLDPAKKLTDDFLDDLSQAASKHRIVLMLDTFEQISTQEDWVRDVAQRINSNSLLVIAGRALPGWDRAWPGWMANTQVEELKPMSEVVMRELIHRYYSTMRGGEPDPTQVNAIIQFARGLPIVVTSAVQLWVKYGVEDFQSVKAEIVANLVDRLIEGVPSALIPALEAAAVVHWFDQPILRSVMKQDDIRDAYNELRHFPFVRARVEGLALHDAVRELMEENLYVQDSERYHELHERAASFFEQLFEKSKGEEFDKLQMEWIYHRICANEEIGIHLFQEMAQNFIRYRRLGRLRILLNTIDHIKLQSENSCLWRDYYHCRLSLLETHYDKAQLCLQKIIESTVAEPKLRAYALCDVGSIYQRSENLRLEGGVQKALQVLQEALKIAPEIDDKLVDVFLHMRGLYVHLGKYGLAIDCVSKQMNFYKERNDIIGISESLINLNIIFGSMGDWRKYYQSFDQIFSMYLGRDIPEYVKMKLVLEFPWGYIWSGRYNEVEKKLVEAINYLERTEDYLQAGLLEDALGYALGNQGKYSSALQSFNIAIRVNASLGRSNGRLYGFLGNIRCKEGELDIAEENLLKALSYKQQKMDYLGIPEILFWLGELYEIKSNLENNKSNIHLINSEMYYYKTLEYKNLGRNYFTCGALTGLVRLSYIKGNYSDICPIMIEAEELAQRFEYNDYLTSLRLIQGHCSLEGHAPNWENGTEAALSYYKQAMVYALRFNRFLVDEVLSGQLQGSMHLPIIPHCNSNGEDGLRLLLSIHDWWNSGRNEIGISRSDTISPIPEGLLLLEAEKMARARELGNGTVQKSVLEQIEASIQN